MTKIDYINDLVSTIPEDKRAEFLAEVAEAAAKYQGEPELSAGQEAEIKRRLADPNPKYVSAAHLKKKFGVDFPS